MIISVLIIAFFVFPANASSFRFEGPSGAVITKELQAFFDAKVDTVILPGRDEDYLTGPLYIKRDDFVLILESGAVLRAAPMLFPQPTHSLISAFRRRNITILGEGDARLVMGGREYVSGEWRHAIRLQGVRDFRIAGLDIDSSGGDGVYVGSAWDHGIDASEDVIIENCRFEGNRRQGISVISARRILIQDVIIRGTSGTAPAAGIDFEPNRPDEVLEDCVVRDTRLENNQSHGALVWLGKFNGSSHPVSIRFENVSFRGSRRGAGIAVGGFFYPNLKGRVEVHRSVLSDNHLAALLVEGLSPESIVIHMDSSVLRHSGKKRFGKPVGAVLMFKAVIPHRREMGGLKITHSRLESDGQGALFMSEPKRALRFRNVLVQGYWANELNSEDIPGIAWQKMTKPPKGLPE